MSEVNTTNQIIAASPMEGGEIEREREERLLNSNFVDQQQIFFLGNGGKINRRGREGKKQGTIELARRITGKFIQHLVAF